MLLADHPRRLRLQTSIRLRWLALAGQLAAVLFVYAKLGFDLPIEQALAVIGMSALLNLGIRFSFPVTHRLSDNAALGLLSFDILQLFILLYLTGGIENPFAILVLAPVMISAAALPPGKTLILAGLAGIAMTTLASLHLSLPWSPTEQIRLPQLYITGLWAAIMLAIGFIGVYAWRVAEEGRQFSAALTATELALSREKNISALDGLAAAAAHKLGTPLATIALVANEMSKAGNLPAEFREDVDILREQSRRCRDILAEIASLGDDSDGPLGVQALDAVLHDVAQIHSMQGKTLAIATKGDGPVPLMSRNPAVIYGLDNLIENAVDFARTRCDITATWTSGIVSIILQDDGPGIAPEVMNRLGDPFISTRRFSERTEDASGRGGLGLGLFIAKTLLERSGATVSARNRPGSGAEISIIWPRPVFEGRRAAT